MYQSWSCISCLHWSYPVEVVARLLPPGLAVHELDGRAWVGLTPFVLGDLRTPVAPASPWFSRFPETNVRTYVVGPDGREGPLVRYRSRRRWPGPVPAASSVPVEVGAPWRPGNWASSTTTSPPAGSSTPASGRSWPGPASSMSPGPCTGRWSGSRTAP